MLAGMTLDLSLVTDPALRAAGDKLSAGTRLDAADGLALFESPDIIGLGSLADQVNLLVCSGTMTARTRGILLGVLADPALSAKDRVALALWTAMCGPEGVGQR